MILKYLFLIPLAFIYASEFCTDEIVALKSWRGDYLGYSLQSTKVSASQLGETTQWEVVPTGKNNQVYIRTCEGAYLSRVDYKKRGVEIAGKSPLALWEMVPSADGKVMLYSLSKKDYLHRPDRANEVTTWPTGLGNYWEIETKAYNQKDEMYVIIAISILMLAGALLWFYKKRKNRLFSLHVQRKFDQLEAEARKEFGKYNDSQELFVFIAHLREFLSTNFSSTNLFAVEVTVLLNNSVKQYMHNLRLIVQQTQMLEIASTENQQWYRNEIEKNRQQNRDIVQNLERFIKHIIESQNNDSQMKKVKEEYETMMGLYEDISAHRKNSK